MARSIRSLLSATVKELPDLSSIHRRQPSSRFRDRKTATSERSIKIVPGPSMAPPFSNRKNRLLGTDDLAPHCCPSGDADAVTAPRPNSPAREARKPRRNITISPFEPTEFQPMTTGKKPASKASKQLSSTKSTKAEKSVAASDLSQAKHKGKRK